MEAVLLKVGVSAIADKLKFYLLCGALGGLAYFSHSHFFWEKEGFLKEVSVASNGYWKLKQKQKHFFDVDFEYRVGKVRQV